VLGCERRPVSASIISTSCSASFPVCVYKYSSHYINNISFFIDSSLEPLATESPCRYSVTFPIQDLLLQPRMHRERSKGCKDQLMISKAIYEDCQRRNKNLSIAWIDYQKAFDSVPHSWVEKSIELVGVNSKIVRFCKLSMEKWNTRLFFEQSRK